MTLEAEDTFFPEPTRLLSQQGSKLAPRTFPGVTPLSTKAVQRILKDNHQRHHVFFNERGFHNHIVHTILTLWCLGADEFILRRSYEEHSKKQRPAFPSPHPITKENWIDHLADENFYQAYVEFFKAELKLRNFQYEELLEEYVFAPSANFIAGAKTQPEMLSRFFDNLFHPMIHVGFGIEFNIPGIFAEGLAQAAMHPPTATKLFPKEFFDESETTPTSSNVHAFNILARVLEDPTFNLTSVPDNIPSYYSKLVKVQGEAIRAHASRWTLDEDVDLQGKIEELIWTSAVIYGVGGMEENGELNADFFLMHLVTSSIFLFTLFSRLTRWTSQKIFLKGYLSVTLSWYVGRGRPYLDVARFFQVELGETLLSARSKESNIALTLPYNINDARLQIPHSWSPILRSALMHVDDHVPKLQRALADHASRFGDVPKGTFSDTWLKDAQLIDGSIFLRTAGLTTSRLGWIRDTLATEEGPSGEWDRRAFFK